MQLRYVTVPALDPERSRQFISTGIESRTPRETHASRRATILVVGISMGASETTPIPVGDTAGAVLPPRLIVADPALQLVARWKTELAVLRRRSPTSDAVKTLTECVQELAEAITSGHQVTVQLTLVEAHEVSRIPVSTLRWLCNHRTEAVGARKREGAWYLDRSRFDTYLASYDARQAVPRTPVRPHSVAKTTDTTVPRVADRAADLRADGR
jgi:hypothetical protein